MKKRNKPYLVTGGCGFVGRHLVKRLMRSNKDIWLIDNLSTGKHPDFWLGNKFKKIKKGIYCCYNQRQKIFFIKNDLIEILNKEIQGINILPEFSDIFHLASIVGGRMLIDGDPILVAKDLAIDSIFFLWATRKAKKIERILYASSSAAYPIALQNDKKIVRLKEKMINFKNNLGLPDMTYGWSKLTGEYLSRLMAQKYGIPVACVRPFSGYGEDQDFTYPIPAIARRVALRRDPLMVWGDGNQGRDFIYIDDCIGAFFLIIDKIHDGSACNIGSGKTLSFLDVARIFCKLEKYKPEIKPLENKPVGVKSRCANISLIRRLGWKPKTSNKEGFAKVLKYIKDNLKNDNLK